MGVACGMSSSGLPASAQSSPCHLLVLSMSQQCQQCQCPDYRIPPEFPTFTASQLARALLLVVSEDLSGYSVESGPYDY